MGNPDTRDVIARVQAAQRALQMGERATAHKLATEAFELANTVGPVQALPDAAFLVAMATSDPEERMTALNTALELFEDQGRADEAAAIRQRLGHGESAPQPAWAAELQTAVSAGDLELAFSIVEDARAAAKAASRDNELATLDSVEAQLRGMQASRGSRDAREGEGVEAHLERLIQRVQFELSTGDADSVHATCEALVDAGAASPAWAIQAGLVVVQALVGLGDVQPAQDRLEICRALLERVPEAQTAFDQVEAIVGQMTDA